jgi:hypothetical protein
MKSSDKYDNQVIKQAWLEEQKENVKRYLTNESINFMGIPKVHWFLVPYVSIWHIKPDLWVISGDLPTDYIQNENIIKVSDVVKYFAKRWTEISQYLLKGKQHPELPIGESQEPKQLKELGLLLQKRATLLLKWIDNKTIWNE